MTQIHCECGSNTFFVESDGELVLTCTDCNKEQRAVVELDVVITHHR